MEIIFPIHKSAIIKNTAETELENQLSKPNSQARLSTQKVERNPHNQTLHPSRGQLSGHWWSTGIGEPRHFLPQLWGEGGSSPGAATVELLKLL